MPYDTKILTTSNLLTFFGQSKHRADFGPNERRNSNIILFHGRKLKFGEL